MILGRYSDGGLMFAVRWDVFARDWRTASAKERVVLNDGRPAIRREPSADEENGEVTYTTLPPALWDRIKSRQKDAFAMNPPPPRTRLCQACCAELRVAREYGSVWTFRCPACGRSETWGKDQPGIGGTWGAGEREKR